MDTQASRHLRALTLLTLVAAVIAMPSAASAQVRPGDRVAAAERDAYRRGYQDGVRRGEQDGRQGRPFDLDRNSAGQYGADRDGAYRSAGRDNSRSNAPFGDRPAVRDDFRRGYADGYRAGYDRTRYRRGDTRRGRQNPANRRGGYGDPAQARGYSDGYEKGFDDGEDRDRFDPLREGDYRDADNGYQREYGSRELYRTNYRAGFARGYEDGYRDGTARRR
jgi:hypothetical protein